MSEQKQAACADMSAITVAHERLHPFAGTFRAEVTMWMGPGDPVVTTGTMESVLDLGGRFLRQTYVGDDVDGPFPNFEGRGYWGFNTVTDRYEGFWIDSASTFMQTEEGDVDAAGRVWTMRGTIVNPESHAPMTKVDVITLVDDDHHTMETTFEMPDGSRHRAMKVAYVRAKAGDLRS